MASHMNPTTSARPNNKIARTKLGNKIASKIKTSNATTIGNTPMLSIQFWEEPDVPPISPIQNRVVASPNQAPQACMSNLICNLDYQ